MATLSVQQMVLDGLEATYASAGAAGDVFTNDGRTMVHVKNGDSTDHTVTFTAQDTSEQVPGFGTVSVTNTTVTITAGEERFVGFFPQRRFNNSSGQVAVTYDSTTSMTIAVVRCPKQGESR